MDFLDLFEQFSQNGRLAEANSATIGTDFANIPWTAHPTFEGVELKQLIGGGKTGGRCSFHLVRIAPNQQIGRHIHANQLETHEVIASDGICLQDDAELTYAPGVIAIMPQGVPHQVRAGANGLYLLAKFIPAQS